MKYEEFFGQNRPQNPLDLIKHLPLGWLIQEISGINLRLKTPLHFATTDIEDKAQLRELEYFSISEKNYHENIARCERLSREMKTKVALFYRHACLYSLEWILQNQDLFENKEYQTPSDESYKLIFEFLLCSNSELLDFPEIEDSTTLETINPRFLLTNERSLYQDYIFLIERGAELIKFLSEHRDYGEHFKEYFKNIYAVSPEEFIKQIVGIMIGNKQGDIYSHVYNVKPELSVLFNRLAKDFNSTETFKLLRIKKYPFYKVNDNQYVLLDWTFLTEKVFNGLINEFWFDYVKPKLAKKKNSIFNIENYRANFGQFVEGYVNDKLIEIYGSKSHFHFFTGAELLHKSSEGEIELADFYLRHSNRIFIGQVKGTSIYDNEKFGGTTDILYKGSKEDFFSSFGLTQLVKSIHHLEENIDSCDNGIKQTKSFHVYPCIVTSEPNLMSPLMSEVFRNEFQLRLDEVESRHKINPITIIHLGELERMKDDLAKKPELLWKILKSHLDQPFTPNLNFTLGKKKIQFDPDLHRERLRNLIK